MTSLHYDITFKDQNLYYSSNCSILQIGYKYLNKEKIPFVTKN